MLTVPAHSCAGFSDINICYNTVMKNRDLSIDEPVVQNGDPVLRKKASAVAPELIGGKTLQGEIQKNHYGQVKRHLQVTIQYIDENGISRVRGAGGFLAHVIQHEIDHLEGILFIDKAHNLEVLSGKDKKQLDRQRQNHIEQLQKHGK